MDLLGQFREDIQLNRYYFQGEVAPVYASVFNFLGLNSGLQRDHNNKYLANKYLGILNKDQPILQAFGPATDAEGNMKLQNGLFLLGLYKFRDEDHDDLMNLHQGIQLLERGLERDIIKMFSKTEQENRQQNRNNACKSENPILKKIRTTIEQNMNM